MHYSYLGTLLRSHHSWVSIKGWGTQIRVGISQNLGELNYLFLFWSHMVNAYMRHLCKGKNYFNNARETPYQSKIIIFLV